MRPRSDLRAAWLTAVLAACGTLAAPSTGDVDLPLSFVGPYQLIQRSQTPNASPSLITSPDSAATQIDEPSAIVFNDRHVVYCTLTTNGHPTIGRAAEFANHPPRSLDFDAPATVLDATQPWEGSVRSPGAFLAGPNDVVLVYAGDGGIGLATSTDSTHFVAQATPIVAAETVGGTRESLAEPSIVRAPDGSWYLVFRSGNAIYGATAPARTGPFTRIAAPLLEPTPADADAGPDAGAPFDSTALSDPAIAILTNAAGRTLYVLFYTARGAGADSTIGVAARYEGHAYSRVPRAVYTERMISPRAGSFELVDSRTAYLWLADGAPTSRRITAAIGPVVARTQLGM